MIKSSIVVPFLVLLCCVNTAFGADILQKPITADDLSRTTNRNLNGFEQRGRQVKPQGKPQGKPSKGQESAREEFMNVLPSLSARYSPLKEDTLEAVQEMSDDRFSGLKTTFEENNPVPVNPNDRSAEALDDQIIGFLQFLLKKAGRTSNFIRLPVTAEEQEEYKQMEILMRYVSKVARMVAMQTTIKLTGDDSEAIKYAFKHIISGFQGQIDSSLITNSLKIFDTLTIDDLIEILNYLSNNRDVSSNPEKLSKYLINTYTV